MLEKCPSSFNFVSHLLEQNIKKHPLKTALIFCDNTNDKRYRFRDIQEEIEELAAALSTLKAPLGSRVLIRLPHSPEFAFMFFACASIGLIAIPLSPSLTAYEVEQIFLDAEPVLCCFDQGLDLSEKVQEEGLCLRLEELKEKGKGQRAKPIRFSGETPAYLVYTSGTTGKSKGVLHAHRSVWGRRPMRTGWTGFSEKDIVLHAGQLNWTYTMGVGLMDPWSVGATAVLYGGAKNSNIWPSLIERYNVSVFVAVPSVFRQILKYRNELALQCKSLERALCAGEPLSRALFEAWKQETGTSLCEALGMSECSTYLSSGADTPVIPGSPGRIQEGRLVQIVPLSEGLEPVAIGELGILAIHREEPGLMLRYWNRQEEEAKMFRGDWFLTGDLARFEQNGYVFFDGRQNDLMNAFGYRVSPKEIEAVLGHCKGLSELAVSEIQIKDSLSIICAFLVAKEGENVDKSELISLCTRYLAKYKHPREYRFVDELPRSTTRKMQRNKLVTLAFYKNYIV